MNNLADRLEALAAKATKGPYRLCGNGSGVAGKKGSGIILRATERFMCREERTANAEIAQTLMNHLPEIIAALRKVGQ